jgi:hypothetical protein
MLGLPDHLEMDLLGLPVMPVLLGLPEALAAQVQLAQPAQLVLAQPAQRVQQVQSARQVRVVH